MKPLSHNFRILLALSLFATSPAAQALETSAAPNATLSDNAAIGTKIDVTAAAAQAAYNSLLAELNKVKACSALNMFYNPAAAGADANGCVATNMTAVTAFMSRTWHAMPAGATPSTRQIGNFYTNANAYPIDISVVTDGNQKCDMTLYGKASVAAPEVRLADTKIRHTDYLCGNGSNDCKKATCGAEASIPPGWIYRAYSNWGNMQNWSELY
jgi:hypothetical protein